MTDSRIGCFVCQPSSTAPSKKNCDDNCKVEIICQHAASAPAAVSSPVSAALGLSGVLVGFSLGLGVLGYHFIAGFRWVDALLNAAMILSSMGPVDTLTSDGAKLFASAYALFSGVVFITATGILLAPMFHRALHRFHIEQGDSR